jgi:hypothetical protein
MDFPALIAFLSELALNNNKPWFEEHPFWLQGTSVRF